MKQWFLIHRYVSNATTQFEITRAELAHRSLVNGFELTITLLSLDGLPCGSGEMLF